ncbi:hypothetical protein E2562_020771 [Oryza meyeriana var. granulata]|uniref:ACT domain-containing protein n=1 Tax=Oryza meyeriana var. granulata TaxID=110450 RepID=A0A6G1CGG5_9ORYZ|nr:hypothetical protein E2562_020771 [Oryza meyeriana var. granulata]
MSHHGGLRPVSPRDREEGYIDMPPVMEDEAAVAAAARRIYERLVECGRVQELEDDVDCFQRQLRLHFRRLPARYLVDMCGSSTVAVNVKAEEVMIHRKLLADCADPANRPVVHARFLTSFQVAVDDHHTHPTIPSSDLIRTVYLHEIVFGCLDKPKLLSQLSALVSEIGLNIREAHVYSTVDGFSLSVFLVDGWYKEEAGGLLKAIKEALRSN